MIFSSKKQGNLSIMARTNRFLGICLLFSSMAISDNVLAQSKEYGWGFNQYLRKKVEHRAFAISRNGPWSYVYGAKSVEAAKEDALGRCNAHRLKRNYAKDCFIVHVNNNFVVPNGHKIMSTNMAMPVRFSIYDGQLSKLQKFDGVAISDFKHGQKSNKKRKVKLIALGNLMICDGTATKNGETSYYYDLRCLKKYRFRGKAKVLGRQKTGYFISPIFEEIQLKSGSSYMIMHSVRK